MKNLLKYISIAFIALISVQCKDEFQEDYDNTTPDASFEIFTSNDPATINPQTINVTDRLVIKVKNPEAGTTFAVFTGYGKYKYQTTYDMKADSLQSKGYGIIMTKTESGTTYLADAYDVAGTYTIYVKSTVINKRNGEHKYDLDSITINVIDPNSEVAKLLSFGTNYPYTYNAIIDDENKQVRFINILKQDSDAFNGTDNSKIIFSSTGPNVYWDNGTGYVKLNSKSVPNIKTGQKIKVDANKGSATTEYTIKVQILISADSTIKVATVKEVPGDHKFSCNAVISGTNIQIPSWPKGTDSCIVTVKTDMLTKIYKLSKNEMPKTITSVAEDGISKSTYLIKAPLAADEKDATVSGISIVTTNPFAIKTVTGGYSCVVTNSSDLNAKIKIDTKDYATIVYDTLSNYSTIKPFTSNSTIVDFSKHDTYYFRVKNGSDVNNFFIKLTELK